MPFSSCVSHSFSPPVWLNPIASLVEIVKGPHTVKLLAVKDPCAVKLFKSMHGQLL